MAEAYDDKKEPLGPPIGPLGRETQARLDAFCQAIDDGIARRRARLAEAQSQSTEVLRDYSLRVAAGMIAALGPIMENANTEGARQPTPREREFFVKAMQMYDDNRNAA